MNAADAPAPLVLELPTDAHLQLAHEFAADTDHVDPVRRRWTLYSWTGPVDLRAQAELAELALPSSSDEPADVRAAALELATAWALALPRV